MLLITILREELCEIMGKRIVIIDGNSLINRAYYAMRNPMITSEGIYTQGIYGFLNMLSKILDDYSPEYAAVAWDRKSPTFRHESYAEYKAGRKKMPPELAMELPLMKEILSAMSISNLEIDGYEADDIIGTVAKAAEREGLDVLIISGDKDELQLASKNIKVLITKKGISEFDLYDYDKMLERYSLTPEQFIDLKGLMGDQSDNIPGIPGVGEKTGIKLLEQFGSIDEMLKRTDEITNKKLREKVEENAQLALMSRKLAEIYTSVPIEFEVDDFAIEEQDTDKLIELYVKLEFNSFLKKLKVGETNSTLKTAEYEFIKIAADEDIKKLSTLKENGEAFLRVVSDHSHTAKPLIYSLYICSDEKVFDLSGSDELIRAAVSELYAKKIKLCGHDIIEDAYVLKFYGLTEFEAGFDTAVADYVLDPSKSNYTLKRLALEYLHTEIDDTNDVNGKQLDLLGEAENDEHTFTKSYFSVLTSLKDILKKKLKENNLEELYYNIELPLIRVLAGMEYNGFTVEKESIRSFGKELQEEIEALSKDIFAAAGEEFNINSPSQLGNILFEKLGLPAFKKTKTGYSTNAEVLERLRSKHEIVDMILRYRTITKLKSTYVDGLIPLISSDSKIRAHFKQTVTATGRLSCTEPNLQNIPIRNEYGRLLRKAFVPESRNNVLIGADYSQIELRVLAHLSGDKNLIEAFNNGDDIHRATASRVFDIDYDKVTSLDRSKAKAVNFGVIYGMSGFGLSEELHIGRKEAERYIEEYFDKHEAVKSYMDMQVALCKERGFSETITGRRRFIREITSSNYMTRSLGERLAMNSPIQGSAADIIKLAMIKVYDELIKNEYKAKLILQVHDELIIDSPLEEEDKVRELLRRNMMEAYELSVSLECSLDSGKDWFELK